MATVRSRKMKKISIICLMALLLAAATGAAKGNTNASSPWRATVLCRNGKAINGPVSPGDEVEVTFIIKNVSTNWLCLAKSSSVITSLETGSPRTYSLGDRSRGSGFMLQTPTWSTWIPGADEYAFVKPGAALRYAYTLTIPNDWAGHPATNITYSAIISANDTGAGYGLRAWTGDISVESLTVPLVRDDGKRSQQPDGAVTQESAPSAAP
jgi:hypothetical protein